METHRYLVVKGKGGLGNRLLALAKVLSRCGGNDPRLLVEWNDRYYSDSPHRNVFPTVFDLKHPAAAKPERSVDIPALETRPVLPASWEGRLGEEVYGNVDADHLWEGPGPYGAKPASLAKIEDIPAGGVGVHCLFSGALPVGQAGWAAARDALMRHVSLNATWKERVDRKVAELFGDSSFTGVHVRFGSPDKRRDLDTLWRRIDGAARGDIFLATDNRGVLDRFRERYGTRVKVCDKWLSSLPDGENRERNSLHRREEEETPVCAERVLREAVMDLFVLARCSVLVCQPNSTFSQIAEFYSRAEKVVYWGQNWRYNLIAALGKRLRKPIPDWSDSEG